MAMFNSYVKLPEGNYHGINPILQVSPSDVVADDIRLNFPLELSEERQRTSPGKTSNEKPRWEESKHTKKKLGSCEITWDNYDVYGI
jgi:hypothetical protein